MLFVSIVIGLFSALIVSSLSARLHDDANARSKRIVWGQPLTDYDSYDAVGYFAYIAKGNRLSYFLASISTLIFGKLPEMTWDSLKCGGALISPSIVQTACHCLAFYTRYNDSVWRGVQRSGWENWVSVAVGWTMISEMSNHEAWSTYFVLHEQCTSVRIGGKDSYSYDIGLIVLQNPPKLLLHHQKVAPVLTRKEIAEQYYKVLRNQEICLYVGFGRYNFNKDWGPGSKSPIMMHGWRASRGYGECFRRILMLHENHLFSDYNLHYPTWATWICSSFFGKQRMAVLPGDSGSPTTCDNIYTGVVSFRYIVYTASSTNLSTDYTQSLAFALYYNAAEYRKSLVNILETQRFHYQWPPEYVPVRTTYEGDVFTNPAYLPLNEQNVRKFAELEHFAVSFVNSLQPSAFVTEFLIHFYIFALLLF